ncbi:MAG: TRAP transporter large permease subunit [Gammaproteobacteria bacterium]
MILLATLLLVVLALAGLPLFVALGGGSLLLAANGSLDSALLIIELNRLASSPNLIAIPLFTLAGVLLAAGGAPQRLIRLFNAMLGWLPGGIAIVTLTVCAFFTSFSGASGVTILALGGLLFPLLTKAQYPEKFSLGLLTTSGSLGLLFPPSLAILLYGIVAGVNIDDLFLAGIVPGLLLMLILAAYALVVGIRFKVPRREYSSQHLWKTIRASAGDIALPVFLITGIFGGFVTISEAAAATVIYVLLLETLIHRSLSIKTQFYPVLIDATVLAGSILIILGMAMGLTNLLIDAQLPMHLLDWIEDRVSSPLQFLLLLNVFLLVVGAMMDIFSATVVVIPLILPLAQRFGIDPIHLGIIFLANLEIGYCTPPVGMNLFIACQRFQKPVILLFLSTLPFLLLMLLWLLLVTYFPVLSLWWRS